MSKRATFHLLKFTPRPTTDEARVVAMVRRLYRESPRCADLVELVVQQMLNKLEKVARR